VAIQGDTKKTGTFEKPKKIEEIENIFIAKARC